MSARWWTRTLVATAASMALLSPASTAAAAQVDSDLERRAADGIDQAAYERGYVEGVRQAERDAAAGRAFDVNNVRAYRSGDRGYAPGGVSRAVYGRLFRNGVEDGYRAGYRPSRPEAFRQLDRGRSGVVGRRPALRFLEPAGARGYDDGYERGLRDGRNNDRYDPVASRDYRDGDNGYSRSYGTRDAYKNNYRAGFRAGYEEGYRDGSPFSRR